jgi:hypothetical protein
MLINRQSEDTRLALLEQSILSINQSLIRIEKNIELLNKKIEEGFSKIENRTWTNIYFVIGGFVGVLGVIAHLHKIII